jgi:hypothetical protein
MNEYSYLHEAEDVWLRSDTVRWCTELWQALPELGFTLDEDVFTVDQAGKPPLWQSPSIVSVHVMHGDREVYDEHSQWDWLKLRFLLATLPATGLDVFVDKATATADRLGLPMLYRGHVVTRDELRAELEACVAELRDSVGEPGSKEVAAVIEMTYPRR